jgi:hypothetical protein
MNSIAQFENRASRSRSKHEGESSTALCDRLSRTRDISQRQLPTDQDYAVSTREYQTDQSSLNLPRLLLALFSKNGKNNDNDQNNPIDVQRLTGHSISERFCRCDSLKFRAEEDTM